MSNIASALKAEIARVARKELRGEIGPLRKAAASYRRDLAALKKRIQQLERQVRSAPKSGRTSASEAAGRDGQESGRRVYFSAARLATHRKKLGLSAAKYAQLLDSSALSVYKWEAGQTRPRRAQLEAIAEIRKLGKKEAVARLEHLEAAA